MSRTLPAKPNLEYLKNEAKDLLRSYEHGDASQKPKLADALHAIALEYGFPSWPKLKEHVESLALTPPESLTAAIRAMDGDKVAELLRRHPELKEHLNDPLANYGGNITPLLAAVQREDRKTIEVLLAAGANIQERSRSNGIGVLDECGETLAQFLIDRGAIVDAHSAARLGMLETLQSLVIAGPQPMHTPGAWGQTPLHFASTIEIAEFLLDQGADINARDLQHESTPAQHMLRVLQGRHYRRDRQDIARYLVSRGCETDILMASALGDLALVRRHLDSNPDSIRTRVDDHYFPKQNPTSSGTIYLQLFGPNRTAHMIARDFKHEDVFRLLMDRSPEDLKLSQACDLGDDETFKALLAKYPNLASNLSDEDRRRLPGAAQNNNTNAVRLMLGAGWPVDERGEYRMSALEWAAWHGNAEMVHEILHYKPQLESKDNDHHITALGSALHGSENGWSRKSGDYVATVEALLAAGAKAPKVTDDLEATEPVKEALLKYLQM